jgi:uncharacterized protein YqjF (DUF2071 family)
MLDSKGMTMVSVVPFPALLSKLRYRGILLSKMALQRAKLELQLRIFVRPDTRNQ